MNGGHMFHLWTGITQTLRSETGLHDAGYTQWLKEQAADEIERLTSIIEDLVSDLASTAASHDEVYYAWEGIVRRAGGMVADIIRKVSAEDDEWDWDVQLPQAVQP